MSEAPAARPIVLASNRGPVSFTREPDGSLVSRRGAGGLISGIGPLMSAADATWIAAAITAGDRDAAARGVVDADGFHVRLLAIEEATYRPASAPASPRVTWFRPPGPRGPLA